MADEFKGNDIKYGNIDEVGLLLGGFMVKGLI